MSRAVDEEIGACRWRGQPTAGARSEGVVRLALCEVCVAADASVHRDEGLWDDGG